MKPTDAAMRAAHAVCNMVSDPFERPDADLAAETIDQETHLPELQEALNVAIKALIHLRDDFAPIPAYMHLERVYAILTPKHSPQPQENIDEHANTDCAEHNPPAKAA